MQTRLGPYWRTINYIVSIWTGGDYNDSKALCNTYRNHYAHVRAVVPKENLLEFHSGSGYKELCDFLGVPIPLGEEYPRINQPSNIIAMHTKLWWFTVTTLLFRLLIGIGSVVIVAGAAWWQWGKYR